MSIQNEKRIVVIDDEEIWREKIAQILKRQGYKHVDHLYPIPPFSELKNRYDLAILDIRMEGFTGLQMTDFFKLHSPTTKVILISQHDNFRIDELDKAEKADLRFHKNAIFEEEHIFVMKVAELLEQEHNGKPNRIEESTQRDMDCNYVINSDGDVIIGNDNARVNVDKSSINRSHDKNISQLLSNLEHTISESLHKLPSTAAYDLKKDSRIFAEQVKDDIPNRRWYEASAKGILDAAKHLGESGKPILETVNLIMKLLI